jgi:hypothetical protein
LVSITIFGQRLNSHRLAKVETLRRGVGQVVGRDLRRTLANRQASLLFRVQDGL